MINVRESKTFYVVRDTVVTDKVDAENKDQVKDIEINERGVRDMDKKEIYDIDEFYDTFGYYPESFYLVSSNGEAVDSSNKKDRESARREFEDELGCTDCEVLTYDEFVDKYGHDPIDDLYEEPFEDDYDDDGDMVDEYGYDWSNYGKRNRDEYDDYGPSNPWDAPGMKVSDFI